jgi:hypothetical protein
MQLHAACAAHCRPVVVTGCWRWRFLLLASGAQGHDATRIPSRTHGNVCGHSSEGGAVLRCEKWRAPYGGQAPGAEQKQAAAESGAALHGFIYAYTNSTNLLSRSPSSCSCPPPPPPDSPLNVALLCLPCLLLSSSRYVVASLANEQTTRRDLPSKAPAPFRCLVLIRLPFANEQAISRVQPFKAPVPFRCLVLIRSALSLPPRTTG